VWDREADQFATFMLSPEAKLPKATVLLIEDSPEVQRYLRILLELDHYRVEVADNGEAGLQRLRDGCTPAVVLLDMQMPGMDGLQTLQRLREIQPELKVVMCSAEDDPQLIRQAIRLGAQAYLVKPVQHLYLSAALDRCFRQSASQPTPAIEARVVTLPSTGLYRPN
jgi:CheY-like chemotaxis protein